MFCLSRISVNSLLLAVILIVRVVGHKNVISNREGLFPQQDHDIYLARWIVSENSWGVISTVSLHLDGAPFGNVVSFSDGPRGNSTGVPYFYLTEMDPTATDALMDSRASFTVTESQLDDCHGADPESPLCPKLTISGQLLPLDESRTEKEFARDALFSKHNEMKGWPKGHNFRFFKLSIEKLFFLDAFGGPRPITVESYLNFKFTKEQKSFVPHRKI